MRRSDAERAQAPRAGIATAFTGYGAVTAWVVVSATQQKCSWQHTARGARSSFAAFWARFVVGTQPALVSERRDDGPGSIRVPTLGL